jgi:2'-5' RNA ligase
LERRLEHPRYALVAPLPRTLEVRIEDLFLGLLGTSKPIMGYHITVVGPFAWVDEPDESRLARIGEICAGWPAFAVRLQGLGAFRSPESNAIYIPVRKAEQIAALHRVLQITLRGAIMPDRELPQEGYLPHITLGLGLTDGELERVMAGVQERKLDERLLVQEIRLVEEGPSAPWRCIQTFALDQREPSVDDAVAVHER